MFYHLFRGFLKLFGVLDVLLLTETSGRFSGDFPTNTQARACRAALTGANMRARTKPVDELKSQLVAGGRHCGRSNESLVSQRPAHGIGQAIVPSLLVVVPHALKKHGVGGVALGIDQTAAERAHQAGKLSGIILRGVP